MTTLSVIVPFYNEEEYLVESVNRLLSHDIYEEIILVNDCSTDNSLNHALDLQKKNKKIQIYNTPINSGKGRALMEVVGKIKSTHVVIHDADLEYFPSDIIGMFELAKVNSNSMILGSRFIGEGNRVNLYSRTYAANKFLSRLFTVVHGALISDVATCYKMFPSNFFNEVNLKENGFSIEIEMTAKFLNIINQFTRSQFHIMEDLIVKGKRSSLLMVYIIF